MSTWNRLFGGAGLAALAVSACLVTPAMAQESTAVLRGSVVGPNGAIPNAAVVITHTPSGTRSSVRTDVSGQFAASGLRPGGPYSVEVSATNYRSAVVADAVTDVGLPLVLSFTLEAEADDRAPIVVRASAIGRRDRMGVSTTQTADDIAGIATATRDIRDIMRRDPLVAMDATNAGAPTIAGASNRANSFTINGVDIRDEFGLNASGLPSQRSPISIDAIQSLSVNVTPYSVEYGNFTGGNINVITRSGTNEFHGTAFYNFQREWGISDSVRGVNPGLRPGYKTDNFGATLSGPIIQDRLFFLVSYENFEAPVRNTTGPAGSTFLNQIAGVTQAELDSITQIMTSVYHYDPLGVFDVGQETDRKILAKIDWNISDNHRASFTYQTIENGVPNAGSTTGRTPGGGRMQMGSYWYQRSETIDTFAAQLNSDWTDWLSTELRYSTKDYQVVQAPFGGTNFASFYVCARATGTGSCPNTEGMVLLGPDASRHANQLHTTTDDFRAKATLRLDAHTVTIGYENNVVDVFNLFGQGANGEYVFDSIAQLQARQASRAFFFGGASDGNGDGQTNILDAAAAYKGTTNTFFIQDQFEPITDVTVMLGARYDIYGVDTAVPRNTNLVARSANYAITEFRNIDNTTTLDGLDLFQPRLGVNWQVNDSLEIRGGVGVFAGAGPQVWQANSYQNNGVTTSNIDITTTSAAGLLPLLANVDGSTVPTGAVTALRGAGLATANTNLIDPNIDMPSALKSNLGVRYELEAFGLPTISVQADVMHQENRDSFIIQNLRLAPVMVNGAPGKFADGRPMYAAQSGQDLILTNRDLGGSDTVSFNLSQEFENGWDWSLGYAHQDSKDGNPMTSSVANSSWTNIATVDANNPEVARSNYEIQDRVTFSTGWRGALIGSLETRVNLFGENRSGYPFSYTFNDPNAGRATGIMPSGFATRGLLYVPTGSSDPIVQYADTATQTAFESFVASSGLANYRGQIAPRNGFLGPDVTLFDLHLSQELPWMVENQHVKFTLDIINLGNLLNDKWGVIERNRFPGTQVLVDAAPVLLGDGRTGYRYSNFRTPTRDVCPQGGSNCAREGLYQIQAGFRFEF